MKKRSCTVPCIVLCTVPYTVLCLACSVFITLALAGCGGLNRTLAAPSAGELSLSAGSEPETGFSQEETALLEPLAASYYEGQSSRAFRMLQKSIFRHLIDDWTDEDIKNPKWNYDTFTRYEVLDSDMNPLEQTTELFCCTYSADRGKSGYMVISYDGDSLSKIGTFETPYVYDLQSNIDAVMALLLETELDPSAVSASRVRLSDSGGTSKEAIRISDAKGHSYLYYFADNF